MTAYVYPDSGGETFVNRTGPQTITGPKTFLAGSATSIPLVVQAASGQTANLTEWQNSSGTILTSVGSSGTIGLNSPVNSGISLYITTPGTANARGILAIAGAADNKVLEVRGAASQTANLAEFQNSAGQVKMNIQPDGAIGLYGTHAFSIVGNENGAVNTATTSAGSIEVWVNGVERKIPYY